jgi:hypothetical protein
MGWGNVEICIRIAVSEYANKLEWKDFDIASMVFKVTVSGVRVLISINVLIMLVAPCNVI